MYAQHKMETQKNVFEQFEPVNLVKTTVWQQLLGEVSDLTFKCHPKF